MTKEGKQERANQEVKARLHNFYFGAAKVGLSLQQIRLETFI
jgi:hypothetical protein